MRQRCFNPNDPRYRYYGGDGITICERWNSFSNFLADMGPKPSPELTLDRIDNDGDYEPGNCRWATSRQQNRNRRDNRRITYQGESLTLPEWAERMSVHVDQIRCRLRRGWSIERTLTAPPVSLSDAGRAGARKRRS